MFERIKKLYREGKLTEAGVYAAVEKGWITQAEARAIISGK